MPAPVSIGQRFTQLIQHLGLSKNAFAQSLDKTATVIQHLVDERNKPGYDLLCKVFETYPNVSKDWLLLGQGPMLAGAADGPAIVPAPVRLPPVPVAEEVPVATLAPVVASPATPAPPTPAPVPTPEIIASAAIAPAPSPMPAAPVPDANYLAVALQTQQLQHQLALAEQRNQHLLEQQQLMQQMVALLQRTA
jgi:plasmid maintenance system antidote protein VapI